MNDSRLVNQTSGQVEWYTPSPIIEAARKTMGSIDLDPFSCELANETVMARRFFSAEEDGWQQDWYGNVFCNYPFGRKTNPLIAGKCIGEFVSGKVDNICLISFASTSEAWFRPLMLQPQCFLHGRTNYLDGEGNKVTGSTKGSVVTFFGDDVQAFYEAFRHLGTVKVDYGVV